MESTEDKDRAFLFYALYFISKTICRLSKAASQKNYLIKDRMVSERNKFIFIFGYEKLSFVSLFSLAPIIFSLSFHFVIFYVILFLDLEAYQTNRTGR